MGFGFDAVSVNEITFLLIIFLSYGVSSGILFSSDFTIGGKDKLKLLSYMTLVI